MAAGFKKAELACLLQVLTGDAGPRGGTKAELMEAIRFYLKAAPQGVPMAMDPAARADPDTRKSDAEHQAQTGGAAKVDVIKDPERDVGDTGDSERAEQANQDARAADDDAGDGASDDNEDPDRGDNDDNQEGVAGEPDSDGESEDGDMCISVKKTTGESMVLRVQQHDTVGTVKRYITNKLSIPRRHQRLIYNDTQLDDDSVTLFDHNIFDGATVKMALRLRGSGKNAKKQAGDNSDSKRKIKLVVSKATTDMLLKRDPRTELCQQLFREMNVLMGQPSDYVAKRVAGLNPRGVDELDALVERLGSVKEGGEFAKGVAHYFAPSIRDAELLYKELKDCIAAAHQVWQHKFAESFMDEAGRVGIQSFKDALSNRKDQIGDVIKAETEEQRRQREFQEAVNVGVAQALQQVLNNPQALQQVAAQNPQMLQQLMAQQNVQVAPPAAVPNQNAQQGDMDLL